MLSLSRRPVPPLCARRARRDQHRKYILDAATRNLGLHYLSEGRVEEARPLLRACLESYEETLRSDMPGGHESLDLITPLTVLSYADMLAGGSKRLTDGTS